MKFSHLLVGLSVMVGTLGLASPSFAQEGGWDVGPSATVVGSTQVGGVQVTGAATVGGFQPDGFTVQVGNPGYYNPNSQYYYGPSGVNGQFSVTADTPYGSFTVGTGGNNYQIQLNSDPYGNGPYPFGGTMYSDAGQPCGLPSAWCTYE